MPPNSARDRYAALSNTRTILAKMKPRRPYLWVDHPPYTRCRDREFTLARNCAEGQICADQDESAPITVTTGSGPGEYGFSSGDWSGTGTLCGTVFTWNATAPDYTESGTWRFVDANNFTKTSDYTYTSGGTGSCTASASSNRAPPPPAPIGPCP